MTSELLLLLPTEVRVDGAELLLQTVSFAIPLHFEPQVRAASARSRGATDLDSLDDTRAQRAEQHELPKLILLKKLREYAEEQAECVHGFETSTPSGAHWNTLGDRIAGELLAARLCATLTTVREP